MNINLTAAAKDIAASSQDDVAKLFAARIILRNLEPRLTTDNGLVELRRIFYTAAGLGEHA